MKSIEKTAILLVFWLVNNCVACQCDNHSNNEDLHTNPTTAPTNVPTRAPAPKPGAPPTTPPTATPPTTPTATPPTTPLPTPPPDNTKRLEAAQGLATDLGGATKLNEAYKKLANHVPCKGGSNTIANFKGMSGMKEALRAESSGGNLSKFKKWAKEGNWQSFHNEHYDWWMFPLDQNTASKGMQYTVFADQIEALKKDDNYLRDYRLGVILLMMSWGWDMKNQCLYDNPGKQQAWTGYQVRLGKLAYSLILFQQWDLYQSVEKFVTHLKVNKGFVKSDYYVQKSFPVL